MKLELFLQRSVEAGPEMLSAAPDFRAFGVVTLNVFQDVPGQGLKLVAQNADGVRANVNQYQRPFAVPGGGTYEFAFIGGAGGERSKFLDVIHGEFVGEEIQSGGPGTSGGPPGGPGGLPGGPGGGGSPIRESREIKWNKEKGIGEVKYQPDEGYTYWYQQTAVVKVIISEEKIRSATQFSTTTDGDLAPYNEFYFDQLPARHGVSTRLTDGQTWSPFGNHSTAGDQALRSHMASKAKVEFENPSHKGRKVGGDKMEAGFVQFWTPVSAKGGFLDHGVHSVLKVPVPGKQYLDTDYKDQGGELLPVINPFYNVDANDYMPATFAPTSVEAAEAGKTISMSDSPTLAYAKAWLHLDAESNTDQIDTASHHSDFTLYVAVRTKNTENKSNLRYFGFAKGEWNVRINGNISAAGEWLPSKPHNGIWVTAELDVLPSPVKLETDITATSVGAYVLEHDINDWWEWVS